MLSAGVDAHKRYSRVVVKDETGSLLCRASLQNDVGSFQEFFSAIDGPTKAVLEAGRDWGVICDLLEGIGVEPVLANPVKPRAIAEARIKTDTVDATILADLLRGDLIPVVHVPSREVRTRRIYCGRGCGWWSCRPGSRIASTTSLIGTMLSRLLLPISLAGLGDVSWINSACPYLMIDC